VKIIRSGITTVPITSMWTSGLRLIRPRDCAVGSPCFSAVQAWADSWTERLKSRTTYDVRPRAMV
jgi:hypothetical protein